MKKKILQSPALFIGASFFALLIFFIFFVSLNAYNESYWAEENDKLNWNNGVYSTTTDPFMTKIIEPRDSILKPVISNEDPMLGDSKSPITLIQYSDFTCEFCRSQEQILRAVMQDYPGKIRLIWKDYPEKDQKSISYKAATAARCAQQQGRFWGFHDSLFLNKSSLNEETLFNIAKDLKLNILAFNSCYNEVETKQLIKNNMVEANALGISGVPYIFINDKEFMGELSIQELKQTVESLLKK